MYIFFTEVTEKCINETEQQLAVLEELVKDANFERQVKDFKSKSMDLQEQKFAELEQLKCINCSICPAYCTIIVHIL